LRAGFLTFFPRLFRFGAIKRKEKETALRKNRERWLGSAGWFRARPIDAWKALFGCRPPFSFSLLKRYIFAESYHPLLFFFFFAQTNK
jgi:hypothetical protein